VDTLPIPKNMPEVDYFRYMEEFRLAYQRGWALASTFESMLPYGAPFDWYEYIKSWKDKRSTLVKFRRARWRRPINLRAYEIILLIERDRRLPPEVTAEIIKHKNALHPYVLKRLFEVLRRKAAFHRERADYLNGIADQFAETSAQPSGGTS
jgi:hypothetical protein